MYYQKELSTNHSLDIVWSVLVSEEFLRQLLRQLSPVELSLPQSFFAGKQHNGVITARGKEYDYSAKLKSNKGSHTLNINIYTDSVDGLITIGLQETDAHNTHIKISVDVDANGVLKYFLGSAKGYIEKSAVSALRLLESKL